MPYKKSNSTFDSLLATTALLNDTELQALADKCQKLIADRERIRRNELRQELMENLQRAIDGILHNDFELTIENTETEHFMDKVYFTPNDTYAITIK